MKGKELRERSDDELIVELKNLREGLFRLRFRQVAESSTHGATEKSAIKRDIARVLTVMRERELAAKKG
jgi:large subunit ribosomal protein L29